jgi:hypothetical protein
VLLSVQLLLWNAEFMSYKPYLPPAAIFFGTVILGFQLTSSAPREFTGQKLPIAVQATTQHPAITNHVGLTPVPLDKSSHAGKLVHSAYGSPAPANIAGRSQLPTATQIPSMQPPSGATVHVVAKGESLPGIVYRYLPDTRFMTGKELEAAIHEANPEAKGVWPTPGLTLIIPGFEPQPWIEKPRRAPRDFEVRAIYLTGAMAGGEHGLSIIRRWRDAGGNAVVFDIKDSDGSLSVLFEHALAPQSKRVSLRNLAKFTRYVHGLDMHAIARIAIFRDEHMVTHHPETAVRSRRNGEPWKENGKLVWTDPSNPEVQDYNIALAQFAAQNGADEVQFDYVRFPAEGDQKDAKFVYETEHPQWKRSEVIVHFLEKAHAKLQPMNVLLSLDVFGVMAWQRPVDLAHTGQDIPEMAKHCDVLSPMIYPSHFFGMDGYALPGDAPEHFIATSMERFAKVTNGTGVVLRPWLQAFGWKTKTYSPEYIRVQVKAAKDKGGVGFLFWNARNDYGKPFMAMPKMAAGHGKFFRGDEVGKPRPVKPVSNETASKAGN